MNRSEINFHVGGIYKANCGLIYKMIRGAWGYGEFYILRAPKETDLNQSISSSVTCKNIFLAEDVKRWANARGSRVLLFNGGVLCSLDSELDPLFPMHVAKEILP